MPQRKKSSYRRKKKTSRRISPYVRYASGQGTPSGFPRQKTLAIRWNDQVQLQSTQGVVVTRPYRANGPYDPDATIAPGQQTPIGLQNMTKFYSRMIVVMSRCRVRWLPGSGGGPLSSPAYVGCCLDDDAQFAYAEPNDYIEHKKGSSSLFTAERGMVTTWSNFDVRKFFNIKDPKDNIIEYGSSLTSTPINQAYFTLWAAGMQGANATVNADITIDYIITFSDPKDPET